MASPLPGQNPIKLAERRVTQASHTAFITGPKAYRHRTRAASVVLGTAQGEPFSLVGNARFALSHNGCSADAGKFA